VTLAVVERRGLSHVEHAAALMSLASHRYFMRLADVGERRLAPDGDDRCAASYLSGPWFAQHCGAGTRRWRPRRFRMLRTAENDRSVSSANWRRDPMAACCSTMNASTSA
jgi:hypothetical protein